MQSFDLVVIGGGPAGYVGAIRAAQLGMQVALVEQGAIGGTCLNRGCVPTKALLHTALLYRTAVQDFAQLGIDGAPTGYRIDALHAHKDEVVATLRGGIAQLLAANGIAVFGGRGSVVAAGHVKVESLPKAVEEIGAAGGSGRATVADGISADNGGPVPDGTAEAQGTSQLQAQGSSEPTTQVLAAKHILVATGSQPARPPIPGADLPGVVTSDDLLRDAQDYKSLVIIGAGAIGVEFAAFYAALGCRVTLLEAAPRALPLMSREVGQSVAAMLKAQGVAVCTAAAVQEIVPAAGGLSCRYACKGENLTAEGEAVLLATGRRPFLQGVFAEGAKPQTDARGFLVVDEHFATSVPGVYAAGDLLPTAQLAHLASAEAVAAVEGMAGHKSAKRLDLVPACVYTEPEIAAVGVSEEAAAEQGVKLAVKKFLMGANARVQIEGAGRSYAKLLADAETGRLLGAELVCPRATDMIGALAMAIAEGMRAEELDATVWPHPSFSEGLGEAGALFGGGAIHAAPVKKPL